MEPTSEEKRKQFEDQFSGLVNKHIDDYKGPHPIVSWNNDSANPEIHPSFFSQLPEDIQSAVELLLAQIAG